MSDIQKNPPSDSEKDTQEEPLDNTPGEEKKKRVYKEFGHEKEGPTRMCLCLLGFRRH
jgi:hypothetical protein